MSRLEWRVGASASAPPSKFYWVSYPKCWNLHTQIVQILRYNYKYTILLLHIDMVCVARVVKLWHVQDQAVFEETPVSFRRGSACVCNAHPFLGHIMRNPTLMLLRRSLLSHLLCHSAVFLLWDGRSPPMPALQLSWNYTLQYTICCNCVLHIHERVGGQ